MDFNNCYKGKKVLITGHTGFKGSWLSIWLKILGAEVYGYSLPPASLNDNFVRCNLDKEIHHTEGDVRDLVKLKDFFADVNPDIAFHLAAQPLVLLSYQDPVGTFDTNLMGVVNFFEAVRATPSVRAAINVTSDKCYDNQEWVWGYRENDPMGGKDPYSASKGCSELITSSYINSYFKFSQCRVASARAGNVIGGGDWALDRIVPDFFRAVLEDRPVVVRNPEATRPWQHVLEPLSGYLNLGQALLGAEGENYSGGWNFGPEDTSNYPVSALLASMIQIHGSGSIESPVLDKKLHEASLLKLDISKAANFLKWRPVLNFAETIQFTVSGYQSDISGTDILTDRIAQINEYSIKAKDKHILWTR